MPNWCQNRLELKGNSQQLKTFVELCVKKTDDESVLDFSGLIPLPQNNEISLREWRLQHWGCNGNASECRFSEPSDDMLCVDFWTPWQPPVAFYRRLAETYPQLEMEARYIEIGEAFCGSCFGKDGRFTDQPESPQNLASFAYEHFCMEI